MSAATPHVVHLTSPAPFGGLERVVQVLATAQRHAGMPTRVVVLHGDGVPEPPLAETLRHEGVEVATVVTPPRAYLAQLAQVRRLLDVGSADVLHSHGYHADVLAAALGPRARAARVSTVHGFTGGGWKNRLYEWLQCRAYDRFDAVIAVSRKLASDLEGRGVPRDRLHVLRNAWASTNLPLTRSAARRALGIADDAFSVGWIGRISREKGLDVLVDALHAARDLDVRLTVIGDGTERAAVADRATAAGVADRISWAGRVPDAAVLLPAFDLLVISSRTEGTPMVLLEAMSTGVPVLTTAVGGIPDVVSGAEALLVPSDSPAALASGLREAWRDRAAGAARAARASRRLASEFAVGPWLASHDDVYRTARERAERGTR